MWPHPSALAEGFGVVLAVLASAGVVYQAVVWISLGKWFARPIAQGSGAEPVTLLKPLHGLEPRLAENLATFLASDYPGPVQVVFGVNAPDDPALAVARSLREAHPEADIALWPGPRAAGANGKIGNLVAMAPLAEHDLLVLSDSDMVVGPDYLPTVLTALAERGVGAVSCLYIGRGDAGLWSRLSAAAISYGMMPDMVLALRFGLSQPCMGSTIALRRTTLQAIGGFSAFRDVLADDYAIGAAVTELGLSIAVPPLLLIHACDEDSLGRCWRHHLRWRVTLRGIVGHVHAGTVVTHALPLALLCAVVMPPIGGPLALLTLALRIAVRRRVDRIAGASSAGVSTLLLSDCFMFAIFCASLVAREIDWRGSRLVMGQNGRIRKHS